MNLLRPFVLYTANFAQKKKYMDAKVTCPAFGERERKCPNTNGKALKISLRSSALIRYGVSSLRIWDRR